MEITITYFTHFTIFQVDFPVSKFINFILSLAKVDQIYQLPCLTIICAIQISLQSTQPSFLPLTTTQEAKVGRVRFQCWRAFPFEKVIYTIPLEFFFHSLIKFSFFLPLSPSSPLHIILTFAHSLFDILIRFSSFINLPTALPFWFHLRVTTNVFSEPRHTFFLIPPLPDAFW